MKPIFIDLHIHTSENPNNINEDYDVDCLIKKVEEISFNSDYLLSLTDHNVINKSAYIRLLEKTKNVLIGVELHIKNYDSMPPYHCHMIFNVEKIDEETIDEINGKLNELYPDKIIKRGTKDVPSLEKIIRKFDSFDFILLPHGGQSHSTFDKSIPRDVIFDTTLERSIYYNQFDGFTARSDAGLETTVDYFKRLGINEFVNLITCTDNYNPTKYPNAKADDASPFVPTWMLALPTFDGLRLSLSESSRLIYSQEKPNEWAEYIKKVTLSNDYIDIEADLTPGLNVVIGGSSSGKTLFVDSINRKIKNDFEGTSYEKFNVNDICVINPSGNKPHYISQNYIIKVIDNNNTENSIEDIEIIKNVFPGDDSITNKVEKGLNDLRKDLSSLIKCVKTIENEQKKLSRIPVFSRLIVKGNIEENLSNLIIPSQNTIDKITYCEELYNQHNEQLNSIDDFLKKNAFVDDASEEIIKIKNKLTIVFEIAVFENNIRTILNRYKQEIDLYLSSESQEQHTKKTNFEKLLLSVNNYSSALKEFKETLDKISRYSIKCETQKVNSMGHTLFIENNFLLSKEKFVEVINKLLKSEFKIDCFNSIQPEKMFEARFKKQSPKVQNYDDFEQRIYSEFEKMNKKVYRIITSEGKNFDSLSAGWKTSVLLDIILGYEGDIAPLIIDQPEDNLATNYINHGLINSIKKIKSKKQVILVSHNATIPMLGDAQNIILCENKDKIYIRSSRLEGNIDGRNMVDYIAEITDGGKSSIKKRVKKYNLKKFRE